VTTVARRRTYAPHPVVSGAFPFGALLDDANRANVSPAGAPWTTGINSATVGLKVVSNQLAQVSGSFTNAAIPGPYGPDVDVWVQVPVLPTSGYVFLSARMLTPTSNWNGYGLVWIPGATQDQYILRRYTNATPTLLLNAGIGKVAAGGWIGMRVKGSTITAYSSADGSTWVQQNLVTDSTYTAAGAIGMELGDATVRADNFSAGTT
jgi:hypothetical protein